MSNIVELYPPLRGLANLPWYTLLGGTGPGNAPNALINLTASANSHEKGAWAQLIASTSEDATLLTVTVGGLTLPGTETSALIDIATGAGGAEQVVAENIAIGGVIGGNPVLAALGQFRLPLRVPAGTRIAARVQALIASDIVGIAVTHYRLGAMHLVPTAVDTLGTDTATSRGTAMTGASGTYTEITASTSRRYRAVVIVPSVPGDTITTARTVRFTAAVGAAGAEVDIGTAVFAFDTSERWYSPFTTPSLPLVRDIPAGSRLSIKHDLANNPGQFAACLIGVP